MKALILAGGSGKEMLPLSAYCPKTLLSLHGKAVLEYVIEGLIKTGFQEFVIVVGHYGEKIEQMVKKYRTREIMIELVDQGGLQGIEGAIQAASGKFHFEGSFLLAYGDIIVSPDFYRHLMNSQINTAADGAIAVTLVGKSSEFGVASIDDHGFISKILPEVNENGEEINYIFAGACILPNEFFGILKEEKRLTSALSRMLKEQRRFCASVWQDEWIDVGYGWDLLEANRDIFKNIEYSRIHKSASISPSAHISGLVFIERNVVIDHNAEIVGPCFIGENTYIGTNSLIRDHACIESNCKIGYSVEIKNSVIQPDTKIGRLSFIGDSVVGERARIGAGVTTMNDITIYSSNIAAPRTIKGREFHKLGAIIGPGSEIGSNTVILPTVTISEDKVISPGSVIQKKVE